VSALATRQHGIVSRRQLRDLGLSNEQIDTRLRRRTLVPVHHGVFAVGHGAIGRWGLMQAAVLVCGSGAVVSHGSAAELLGLWDRRPALIDVTSPGQAGREIDGVRWRRPVVRDDEATIRDGIPCTTAARTLVDLAATFGDWSLRRMIEQAAVLQLLDVAQIDQILSRGRRRGAPRLRSMIAAWRDVGADRPRLRSPLEARLLAAIVEAGLPRPRCNVVLRVDGVRFEVDMLWEAQRLVVETDGERTHRTHAAFHRDRRRDQVLVAAGYRTARVTWGQLEDEPTATIERIGRMLAA
jgi:hypothetical protein